MHFPLVALCALSLIFTDASVAGTRGLGWSKQPIERLRGLGVEKLVNLSDKAKQLGAGLLLAGLATCYPMACTADEVAPLPEMENRVTALADKHRVGLDQIIVIVEHGQTEETQIGIIRISDENQLILETGYPDQNTFTLLEGEILINNSESPLKVTLHKETNTWGFHEFFGLGVGVVIVGWLLYALLDMLGVWTGTKWEMPDNDTDALMHLLVADLNTRRGKEDSEYLEFSPLK